MFICGFNMGLDSKNHKSCQFIKFHQSEVGQTFEQCQCDLQCCQHILNINNHVDPLKISSKLEITTATWKNIIAFSSTHSNNFSSFKDELKSELLKEHPWLELEENISST